MSTNIFESPEGYGTDLGMPDRVRFSHTDETSEVDEVDLGRFSVADLLKLRTRIDERLPASALADLDLERESVVQYMQLTSLQQKVLESNDIPANQKSQVANATAAALRDLGRIQVQMYTPERLKLLEATLIEVLNKWPAEMTREFFAEYEKTFKSFKGNKDGDPA